MGVPMSFDVFGYNQVPVEEITKTTNRYDISRKSQEYLDRVLSGDFPENAPDVFKQGVSAYEVNSSNFGEAYVVRTILLQHGIYPLIENCWIQELAGHLTGKQCLEIMAGSGWLSHGLRNAGINSIATDRTDTYSSSFGVTCMDAMEAIEKFPADSIIVSWPPVSDDYICDVMDKWGTEKEIVYIGEIGGCTACDDFHANFKHHVKIEKDNWENVHDHIYIGKWRRRL